MIDDRNKTSLDCPNDQKQQWLIESKASLFDEMSNILKNPTAHDLVYLRPKLLKIVSKLKEHKL